MCWFEGFLWRSPGGELELSQGFGLVPGIMTPHSMTEPDRVVHLKALVARGEVSDAVAVDDGAALVLSDGAPSAAHPGDGPPFVHQISSDRRGKPWQEALMI